MGKHQLACCASVTIVQCTHMHRERERIPQVHKSKNSIKITWVPPTCKLALMPLQQWWLLQVSFMETETREMTTMMMQCMKNQANHNVMTWWQKKQSFECAIQIHHHHQEKKVSSHLFSCRNRCGLSHKAFCQLHDTHDCKETMKKDSKKGKGTNNLHGSKKWRPKKTLTKSLQC